MAVVKSSAGAKQVRDALKCLGIPADDLNIRSGTIHFSFDDFTEIELKLNAGKPKKENG